MAVNFTNSPSDGATITADGRTYTFSSSTGKWDVTSSPGDTLLSLTDVGSDGTNGQVLTTNGSGSFTFTTVSSAGLSSLVEDTTPQLGGDLDVNGQSLVSVSNGNISITPNGSGKIILDGLSWPTADGTANYVLKTDGSGNLSWTAQSSGGGASVSTSDTAPSSPSSGDLWFDTTELTPYIYYADGSSNQWVEFANPDSGGGVAVLSDLTNVSATSPSSGQVLKWSGSEWAPAADSTGSGGIASVVADTTPQLGGNLDVNGQDIVSIGNGNIDIKPDGSGNIVLDNHTWPNADGSANQVLTTNGSGVLSWASQSGGGGFVKAYRYDDTLAVNTGSKRLYLHDSFTLNSIDAFVDTAPAGAAATIGLIKNSAGSAFKTITIADGASSSVNNSDTTTFSEGDYITVNITQVGSSTAGANLYLVFSFS